MSASGALPPLREVIAAHGLGADKRFGQHFLMDLNITAKIARALGDISEVQVIEVGPGPGGLTRALLAENAGEVVAVEKDRRFMPALEEVSAAYDGRLSLVEADALAVDEAGLKPLAPSLRRRMIASNLPYNVGTALLIKWLCAEPVWWARMALMFQKEVAERVVARVGEDAYGRLAVIAAARSKPRYLFTLPARAFTPPPKVDSAVVLFEPLESPFEDVEALETVTAAAFGQRRKTLRKSLGLAAARCGVSSEALLLEAGIEPSLRAERVEPEGFFRLARAWRSAKDGSDGSTDAGGAD